MIPCVRHPFTVRPSARDRRRAVLADLAVGTAVHYPVPVPEQSPDEAMVWDSGRRWPVAERVAREVLSLPCLAEPTDHEVDEVADAVRAASDRVR